MFFSSLIHVTDDFHYVDAISTSININITDALLSLRNPKQDMVMEKASSGYFS